MEEYRTIRGTAAGEYEEKKSRFLAVAAHVESEAEAVAFLEQVRAANRTARHNVYAYKLREGSRERYSDDGEPAKTAGTPVLEVIGHSGLTDLIVVVTRYFGGILLGTGGLVRAYTTAANRTARHNVYAYKLREGSRERYSDDGEPAKTAGTPVLEVIGHSGLTDLIVVVTRYFGGILLGTGGLVRAYTTAASRALDAAEKVTVQPVVKLSTMVEYPLYERVDLLVAAAGGRMEAPVFTDKVALTWQMRAGTEAPLLEQLRELTRGRGRVEVSEPFYGAV